jgi:cell division protein FtsQ
MTRRSGKKRRGNPFVTVWQVFWWAGSSFLKVACLLVCLMLISVLLLAGYQFLLQSPYIRLEKVVVSGVDEKIKRELLEISGLRSDMTLLSVNLKEVKQNLEQHPWVKSVQLMKHYPHTLEVRAEREEAWALLSSGGLYYLDRRGRVFKEVGSGECVDYPVISGDFNDEDRRKRNLELAAHVLEILEGSGPEWMRDEISEVHLQDTGNVSLYFQSLPAMVQVKAEDLEHKIDELNMVVEHLRETDQLRRVTGINLHYRDGAVVSFKRG